MPQTIIGIDIGTYSVKIAKIERSFKSFEFVDFFERKILYNEILKPEESISVTLQGMIDDFGIKWDQVICGYPGQKVSSRVVTLPFGSLKKIDQTLEFELEAYIPFDLTNLIVDYYVLTSSKESSDVLTLYTLRDEFARWFNLLQNCRVDPKIITVEEVEYLNLVSLGMVPPEGPYAILDIGHTKTNLVLCKGKKLSFVRSVSVAGKQITETIQKKLNVPHEEAERMKIEMGGIPQEGDVLDDLSRQVGEAMKEAVDELILNIRQAFFAFQNKEGVAVEGIYLCGGTSRIPTLDRYLSMRLKQNVTHIDCTSFHFTKLGKVAAHRAMMTQGLALALRGVAAGGMPSINFRVGDFAYKGDVEKLGGTLRHVGIAVGLILFLALTHFGVKYYLLSKHLNALNSRVTGTVQKVLTTATKKQLSSPGAALKLLQSDEARIQDRVSKLSGIKGLPVLDVIKEISAKVPGRKDVQLDVEDLNIKGDKMNLSGRVDSFVAVDKIKAALEASPYFKKVTTGNVGKGIKEGEVKFEMTMELSPKEEK